MKASSTRFRQCASVLACSIAALLSLPATAQTTATTDPVGFFTLQAPGATDTQLSLPMEQAAIFAGSVVSGTSNTLTVSAGTSGGGAVSPAWTADQFVFAPAAATPQTNTYYAEFATGALKGLKYRITANGTNTLTLDTEGDDLTNNPPLGAVAANDSIRIRPYWRIKDIFESAGAPLIEARTLGPVAKDDILIPDYTGVGPSKAPKVLIYYFQGWKAAGQNGDFSNYVLRPGESIILRRRNAAALSLVNLGGVSMNKSLTFVAGGDGTKSNDTFISLSRPAPVNLDDSGLRNANPALSAIKESTSDILRQDEVLAFPATTGFNRAPTVIYYYKTGEGWKQVGAVGTVGATAFLQPGTNYIVRKKAANPGVDWQNTPNY